MSIVSASTDYFLINCILFEFSYLRFIKKIRSKIRFFVFPKKWGSGDYLIKDLIFLQIVGFVDIIVGFVEINKKLRLQK